MVHPIDLRERRGGQGRRRGRRGGAEELLDFLLLGLLEGAAERDALADTQIPAACRPHLGALVVRVRARHALPADLLALRVPAAEARAAAEAPQRGAHGLAALLAGLDDLEVCVERALHVRLVVAALPVPLVATDADVTGFRAGGAGAVLHAEVAFAAAGAPGLGGRELG